MTQQQVEVIASSKSANQQCRSCKARVTFYKTANGKWHPFNGDPPLEIQEDFLEGAPKAFIQASESHFVTCPDAAEWRKRNR